MKYSSAIQKRIESLLGKPSRSLMERCPRGHVEWPQDDCTEKSCDWWIDSSLYRDCSFLAAQIRDHTLTEIGNMMGISRERVRQIEGIAINKLKASFRMREIVNVLHKQGLVKRSGQDSP